MAKDAAKPKKPSATPKKAARKPAGKPAGKAAGKPAKKAPRPLKIFDPLGPGHRVSTKSGG